MGLKIGKLYSYVRCGDPCGRGCKKETEKRFGIGRAEARARDRGWSKDEETGKWTCLACLEFEYREHQRKARGREDEEGVGLYTP